MGCFLAQIYNHAMVHATCGPRGGGLGNMPAKAGSIAHNGLRITANVGMGRGGFFKSASGVFQHLSN